MKKHVSSYLILQKIITSLCRMKCRDTTETKTIAPFGLWWSIIRISKIYRFTHQFVFSLITWIMIPVLSMNSRHIGMQFIQDTLPQIKHIEDCSNVCAGQQKNFKNLMNLCNHVNHFGFDAIWSFFGTSHDKSSCDGIWGTMNRKTAPLTLQRPVTNQILTFNAVEEFCNDMIVGITFFSIYKKYMTIFIGLVPIWDMYPSIGSSWLLKVDNVQAMVDSSSLRSKNWSTQTVFLKICNIPLIIWRYIQPFDL